MSLKEILVAKNVNAFCVSGRVREEGHRDAGLFVKKGFFKEKTK
jgi:hypothetical protein